MIFYGYSHRSQESLISGGSLASLDSYHSLSSLKTIGLKKLFLEDNSARLNFSLLIMIYDASAFLLCSPQNNQKKNIEISERWCANDAVCLVLLPMP